MFLYERKVTMDCELCTEVEFNGGPKPKKYEDHEYIQCLMCGWMFCPECRASFVLCKTCFDNSHRKESHE